ncbi:MAG: hypothetical protein WC860_07905 [Candidatus Margulisiibacteriota bacterium]|jgi:hypothetical protein
MFKNEKMLVFPIPYAEGSISKQVFNKAVAKIKSKFSLDHKRATELIEDIVKAMISENKLLPKNKNIVRANGQFLIREIDNLDCPTWSFLREKTIAEVLLDQKIKGSHHFFI